MLTGTPVQNNLKELWALLHWIFPSVFVTATQGLFDEAFDISNGKVNTQFIESCKSLLQLIMLRRMKDSPEVGLGIPPKTEFCVILPLTQHQREFYKTVITGESDDFLNTVFGTEDQTKERKLLGRRLNFLLLQLRRICLHPNLVQGEDFAMPATESSIADVSSKFIFIKKFLRESLRDGTRVLVFSEWRGTLDICETVLQELKEELRPDGVEFRNTRIDGDTKRPMRSLQVRLFQDSKSDYMVMLCSILAAGTGLNLTAATKVVFMDEHWNPQIMLQAEARAHRLGQENPVEIYKLRTLGTVEEQMISRIQKKLYLSKKVLGGIEQTLEIPDDSKVVSVDEMTSVLRHEAHEPASTVPVTTDDHKSLQEMSLEELFQKYASAPKAHDQLATSSASDSTLGEEVWLAVKERVKCRNFEGLNLKRVSDATKVDESAETQPELRREDRRKGKETTVLVDGFWTSKASVGCKNGEAVAPFARPRPEETESRRMKDEYLSQTCCHMCKEGHESLEKCKWCPRVYHEHCLTIGQTDSHSSMSWQWQCPQHHCTTCERSVTAAGGLLFKCASCPRAFCDDCLDWDSTKLLGNTILSLELLGYGAREHTYYIECPTCNPDAPTPPSPAISTPTPPTTGAAGLQTPIPSALNTPRTQHSPVASPSTRTLTSSSYLPSPSPSAQNTPTRPAPTPAQTIPTRLPDRSTSAPCPPSPTSRRIASALSALNTTPTPMPRNRKRPIPQDHVGGMKRL